mmetsp:Transcript_10108/g.15216  ORF Transcript_10108/g.15216 Transcript_10108/m.15216 type:complete len:133 (+) Transcript_10108:359-757(+)
MSTIIEAINFPHLPRGIKTFIIENVLGSGPVAYSICCPTESFLSFSTKGIAYGSNIDLPDLLLAPIIAIRIMATSNPNNANNNKGSSNGEAIIIKGMEAKIVPAIGTAEAAAALLDIIGMVFSFMLLTCSNP